MIVVEGGGVGCGWFGDVAYAEEGFMGGGEDSGGGFCVGRWRGVDCVCVWAGFEGCEERRGWKKERMEDCAGRVVVLDCSILLYLSQSPTPLLLWYYKFVQQCIRTRVYDI